METVTLTVLNNPLVFVITLHSHLYHLLLTPHLLKLNLLLVLSHLYKQLVRNKSQSNPLVTVSPSTTHSVNISNRRHILVLCWLVVIYHQCNSTNINTTTNRLSTQQNLHLFILQTSYPCSLRSRTIVWMKMIPPFNANRRAIPVNVVHLQIVLTHF